MMNNANFSALVGSNPGQFYGLNWAGWAKAKAYHGLGEIWSAKIDLQPKQTIKFVMRVQHRYLSCDSFQNGDNPVRNWFSAKWHGTAKRPGFEWKDLPPETKLWTEADKDQTVMVPPPACDLKVAKSVVGTKKISFDIAHEYAVVYENKSSAPAEVETLTDRIRIIDFGLCGQSSVHLRL